MEAERISTEQNRYNFGARLPIVAARWVSPRPLYSAILICRVTFEMFANHKDVSNIWHVEAKRETNATQAVLGNMNFDDCQRPKPQDQTINYRTKTRCFWKNSEHILPRFVFEIVANHKDMSNILRVEAKRETIAIQDVLENMNFDDYQRPETQDRAIN